MKIVSVVAGVAFILILATFAQIGINRERQLSEISKRIEQKDRDREIERNTPKYQVIRFRDATTGTLLVSDNDYKLAMQLAQFITPTRD